MNTPLNDTTQQKARDLARKITVAHDLDPEIQEELYGHIEDKLLAYTSGEERVSDEDAFILVREHFGNAKVLASMFAEVHEAAATLTLGRLIGAACVITLAVAWLCKLLALPFQYGALHYGDGVGDIVALALTAMFATGTFTLPAGVAGALYYWRKRLQAGKRPWFYRWSPWRFLGFGILLLAGCAIMPDFLLPANPFGLSEALWRSASDMISVCGWFAQAGLCVAWLWWCGADWRRPHSVAFCLGGWVMLHVALNFAPIQLFVTQVSGGTGVDGFTGLHLWGESYAWMAQRSSSLPLAEQFAAQLWTALRLALFGLLIDGIARQFNVKPTPEKELTDHGRKRQIVALSLMIVALSGLMFEKNGLTSDFIRAEAVLLALTVPWLLINWLWIPRAIAAKNLYRLRALRSFGNLFLVASVTLPHRVVDSSVWTIENRADAFFLASTALALACMAAEALVNWRKRNAVPCEPDGSVTKS